MIAKILEFLRDPAFWGVVAALVIALRAFGEMFKKIGEMIPGDDWAEGISAWISKACTFLGKVMAWLGVGNAK